MTSPFAYPAFRSLFAAQICSLVAVGLMTVGLSLAAYRIGGAAAAGQILGLLLALKMVAYVVFAPLAEPLLAKRDRKSGMIGLDLGRLVLLIPMAFATETWHLAALAFVFFVLASGFTPLFQSVIPDLLPDEEVFTRALVISRIAYTLEAVLSPIIAAAALRFVPAETLFLLASLAFAGSVAALLLTRFPERPEDTRKGPFLERAAKGSRIFRHTPRLRGLFLLNFAMSLTMAWVIVNSVVYAGTILGDPKEYPILMAAYGAGAVLGAQIVPRALKRMTERRLITIGVLGFAAIGPLLLLPLPFAGLLVLWAGFGMMSSMSMTPGGLVLVRSGAQADRPALFAAQFSLSHAGWLIAYPLAGWLGTVVDLEMALSLLCVLSVCVCLFALRQWPAEDPLERVHSHPELHSDHPHLKAHAVDGADPQKHRHAYHIDDLHPHWA